jgi:hypothetical protein
MPIWPDPLAADAALEGLADGMVMAVLPGSIPARG